jgi:hypothetical protein
VLNTLHQIPLRALSFPYRLISFYLFRGQHSYPFIHVFECGDIEKGRKEKKRDKEVENGCEMFEFVGEVFEMGMEWRWIG